MPIKPTPSVLAAYDEAHAKLHDARVRVHQVERKLLSVQGELEQAQREEGATEVEYELARRALEDAVGSDGPEPPAPSRVALHPAVTEPDARPTQQRWAPSEPYGVAQPNHLEVLRHFPHGATIRFSELMERTGLGEGVLRSRLGKAKLRGLVSSHRGEYRLQDAGVTALTAPQVEPRRQTAAIPETYLEVLREVPVEGPITVAELMERVIINRNLLGWRLTQLKKRGLLHRAGRGVYAMTETGRAAVAGVPKLRLLEGLEASEDAE